MEAVAQAYIDNIAPPPKPGSRWDAIFLFGETIEFQDYFGWFWANFVNPEGDLHQEWQQHRSRSHDPRYHTDAWRKLSRLEKQGV